jgi:hypothetical protein
MPKTT